MVGKIEQLICSSFCVKLGKLTTKIHEKLREIFGEHAISRRAAWRSHFKVSILSVERDEYSGRPSTSEAGENDGKNRELFNGDRR
jgi:hypothetical protein